MEMWSVKNWKAPCSRSCVQGFEEEKLNCHPSLAFTMHLVPSKAYV